MHKSAMKCNETQGKWCKNKHGASKIIDTFETYHFPRAMGLEMELGQQEELDNFYTNKTRKSRAPGADRAANDKPNKSDHATYALLHLERPMSSMFTWFSSS
jgi:hypothetical protein